MPVNQLFKNYLSHIVSLTPINILVYTVTFMEPFRGRISMSISPVMICLKTGEKKRLLEFNSL
jgi:hypothetical protein